MKSTCVRLALAAAMVIGSFPNAFAQAVFTDITTSSGVRYSGFVGRSWDIGIADVTGDGINDLYCMGHTQGRTGFGSLLYRSNGSISLSDITSAAFGSVGATGGGQGCLFMDLDHDGDLDLMTGSNDWVGTVFRNNGNGTFSWYEDMEDYHGQWWAREITGGDIDGDGDLDLVRGVHQQHTRVSMNDGNGVYTNSTLLYSGTAPCGMTLPILADMDNDGDLDIIGMYMSAFQSSGCSINRPITVDYYRNNGSGTFQWVSDTTGLLNGEEECVPLVADFDNDADLDVIQLVSNGEGNGNGNRYYVNDGTGNFTEQSSSRGLSGNTPFTDWWSKAICGDFDNDGDIDLYYNRGLWTNDGSGNFSFSSIGGYGGRINGAGDLDGDGDLDLAGARAYWEPASDGFWVKRNETNTNGWLQVRVDDEAKNRFGVGAKVWVYDGTTLVGYKQVIAASAMQGPLEQHFGLGSRSNVRVEVLFPDGTLTVLNSVAAGQRIVVTKDSGGQTQPPSPPIGVSASEVGFGEAQVSWALSGDPTVTGYRVYYGTSPGALDENVNAMSSSSIVIPGLPAGTHYFAVTAYNNSGQQSAQSPPVQIDMQGADVLSPALFGQSPGDGETLVPVNQPIVFTVSDDKAGVDQSSLVVKVNGVTLTNLAFSGDASQYLVTATPDDDYPPVSTVLVEVSGADLAAPANIFSTNWTFETDDITSIEEDAPTFTSVFPADGVDGVDATTKIRVSLTDEDVGVDAASITFYVNDVPVPFTTSGDPFNMTVEFDNPDGFAPGARVDVRVGACDLTTPANCTELQYGFTVETSAGAGADPSQAIVVPDGYWVDDPTRPLEVQNLPAEWSVRIFEPSGQPVRTYTNTSGSAVDWTWDFKNDKGRAVAPALYLVRITGGDGAVQRTARFLVQADS